MDKQIRWDPDYDFAMLSMMQEFTDTQLIELGMDSEEITRFREYEKRVEITVAVQQPGDYDLQIEK